MPEPKQRSATWLSSTYAVDDESEEAKYCSGGYQVRLQPLPCDTDSWNSIERRLQVAAHGWGVLMLDSLDRALQPSLQH